MNENMSIERISGKLAMIAEEKNTRFRNFVFGIVVAPIVLTLLGMIAYGFSYKGTGSKSADSNVVVAQDNIDEVKDSTNNAKGMATGSFETSMTTDWHFSSGKAMSEDAYVQNVLNNTNDVFFDVVLADDLDHVIYKSPVIPRGSYLENIVLDDTLDAGTYDCVLIYHLINDSKDTVSSLQINIKITIAK